MNTRITRGWKCAVLEWIFLVFWMLSCLQNPFWTLCNEASLWTSSCRIRQKSHRRSCPVKVWRELMTQLLNIFCSWFEIIKSQCSSATVLAKMIKIQHLDDISACSIYTTYALRLPRWQDRNFDSNTSVPKINSGPVSGRKLTFCEHCTRSVDWLSWKYL